MFHQTFASAYYIVYGSVMLGLLLSSLLSPIVSRVVTLNTVDEAGLPNVSRFECRLYGLMLTYQEPPPPEAPPTFPPAETSEMHSCSCSSSSSSSSTSESTSASASLESTVEASSLSDLEGDTAYSNVADSEAHARSVEGDLTRAADGNAGNGAHRHGYPQPGYHWNTISTTVAPIVVAARRSGAEHQTVWENPLMPPFQGADESAKAQARQPLGRGRRPLVRKEGNRFPAECMETTGTSAHPQTSLELHRDGAICRDSAAHRDGMDWRSATADLQDSSTQRSISSISISISNSGSSESDDGAGRVGVRVTFPLSRIPIDSIRRSCVAYVVLLALSCLLSFVLVVLAPSQVVPAVGQGKYTVNALRAIMLTSVLVHIALMGVAASMVTQESIFADIAEGFYLTHTLQRVPERRLRSGFTCTVAAAVLSVLAVVGVPFIRAD